jgi:hypothetical protein
LFGPCDNDRRDRISARTSEGRPRSSAITTVSPIPASSQPAEPASADTIASADPGEVSVFSAAHATKNSSGGDTTTGSRPLGRT